MVANHEWVSKRLIYPDEKIIKVCKYCGADYRPGKNDTNLCGGARSLPNTQQTGKRF